MAKCAIKGGNSVRTKSWPAWPTYTEREKELLLKVLESRNWGGYPSPNVYAKKFGAAFAAYQDAKYGVCCANGTVSLEMCLRAGGLKAGDEVIVPPYTWIATAVAAVTLNCVPVFADVTAANYTIDPDIVETLITDKTRAIICVHLGSSIADLDRLKDIAQKHNLILVEDCAHMHGGKWRGKGVGSHGDFGSFSMQSSKLMTSGEGGLVTTNDHTFNQKLLSLVNCGRKGPGYDDFAGNLLGWNYRIGEFQAAVLLAQLERLEEATKHRAAMAAYLTAQLDAIDGIATIKYDERTTQPAHYQYIFKYDPAGFKGLHRDKFLEALAAEGMFFDGDFYEPIPGRDIVPLRASEYPMLRARYGDECNASNGGDFPVTRKATFDEAVWMHYPYLMGGKEDIDDIVAAIRKIQDNVDELL